VRLLKWFAALVALYAVYAAGFFLVMTQSPEKFASVIAGLPMPIMMTIPFERMWNVARGGTLAIGDRAPDFDLETYDRKSRVRLSTQLAAKPVVLVFGSYT
jgi:hypothetical protein